MNKLAEVGQNQIRRKIDALRVIGSQSQGSFITRKQGGLKSKLFSRIDIIQHVVADI